MNKRFLNYSSELSIGDGCVAVVLTKRRELEEVGE